MADIKETIIKVDLDVEKVAQNLADATNEMTAAREALAKLKPTPRTLRMCRQTKPSR